jgi:rubrerythrin
VTPNRRTSTQQHLEESFTAEARNHIRDLHLADRAGAAGAGELAAVLRDQATQEELHALRLYELASADGFDLVTGAPVRTAGEVLEAALLFTRGQAEETAPWLAGLARADGREDVAAWLDRHGDACRAQVERLERLLHS